MAKLKDFWKKIKVSPKPFFAVVEALLVVICFLPYRIPIEEQLIYEFFNIGFESGPMPYGLFLKQLIILVIPVFPFAYIRQRPTLGQRKKYTIAGIEGIICASVGFLISLPALFPPISTMQTYSVKTYFEFYGVMYASFIIKSLPLPLLLSSVQHVFRIVIRTTSKSNLFILISGIWFISILIISIIVKGVFFSLNMLPCYMWVNNTSVFLGFFWDEIRSSWLLSPWFW